MPLRHVTVVEACEFGIHGEMGKVNGECPACGPRKEKRQSLFNVAEVDLVTAGKPKLQKGKSNRKTEASKQGARGPDPD